MNFLDRIPFLTKHKGKRELIFVILLTASIMISGLVMAQLGWLYKDVPTSATPTAIVAAPPGGGETPIATPGSTPEARERFDDATHWALGVIQIVVFRVSRSPRAVGADLDRP